MRIRRANTRSRAFLGVFLVNVQVIPVSQIGILFFQTLVIHEFGATVFRVFPRFFGGVDNLWIELQFVETIFSLVSCLNALKCAKEAFCYAKYPAHALFERWNLISVVKGLENFMWRFLIHSDCG